MPWKESSVMDERLRFVARLLDGESMTEVCRDFGVSRKTGYKIFDRYKQHGLEALADRSRRPVRFANQLPAQLEARIVAIKREKQHWGARKIRELLVRDCPATYVPPPRAPSTPCCIGTGSSSRQVALAAAPWERRCRAEQTPTNSGVPTSRANSSSAMDAIVIPSPSPIMPRATCCCARPRSPPARTSPPRRSNASSARGLPDAIRSDTGVPFCRPNARPADDRGRDAGYPAPPA